MKENNEIESEINEYITKDFEPNKQINDLITLLQKTIMSYYQTKGTDKEEEYNNSYIKIPKLHQSVIKV